MGLPVADGNDTAWDQTPGYSDAATLLCSALDRCATFEALHLYFYLIPFVFIVFSQLDL